ncbi:phage head-tail adapter protein [Clostridium algidicarnis]|uniref:phage head-tail adapter protein n=2 Tax=Clostridium algidicarnis TaxID=37659 RepID=UPI001C0B0C0B|nr:phage head-tail adapter protein [Clostridium algidicarnis]MBU3206681.1 phage head-tail adapter protein [Clostridium algidicarnis]
MKTKQERSEIFKSFQTNIKRKNSFELGKEKLIELRNELMSIYDYIFSTCNNEEFVKMPLPTDKTIAYYLYHLTRIEDITSNTLIAAKEQIFFTKNYDKLLNCPIITTGNEISRDKLIEFSSMLDINQLKNYIGDVLTNTTNIIKDMSYEDSRTKVSDERKIELLKLHTVAADEKAFWLIDYWCNKTFVGLLLMPFSRHQMLHLDGCLRIISKIKK